jgi:hypothetical protein
MRRAALTQFDRAIEAARRMGQASPFEVYRARGHAHELLGDFAGALQDYTQALTGRATADRSVEWHHSPQGRNLYQRRLFLS